MVDAARVHAETASLSVLARRLSEPWPAETELFRRSTPTDEREDETAAGFWRHAFPHVSDSRDGHWQHRRAWWDGEEWRGPVWVAAGLRHPGWGDSALERYDAVQRDIRADHGVNSAGRQPRRPEPFLPPSSVRERWPRSWMPSIAGVGPAVLRFAPGVEQPEVEEWRTYERIRKHVSIDADGKYISVDYASWAPGYPPCTTTAAKEEAMSACEAAAAGRGVTAMTPGIDDFARAVHERLVADLQPRHLPAAAKHLGARPRDWQSARLRRRWRNGGPAPHVPMRHSNRLTLGTLAARYTGRRPDGSYNRHDARRWMRAFARVVPIASDALLDSRRTTAIAVLCTMVGMEDAVGLTQSPRAPVYRADWGDQILRDTVIMQAPSIPPGTPVVAAPDGARPAAPDERPIGTVLSGHDAQGRVTLRLHDPSTIAAIERGRGPAVSVGYANEMHPSPLEPRPIADRVHRAALRPDAIGPDGVRPGLPPDEPAPSWRSPSGSMAGMAELMDSFRERMRTAAELPRTVLLGGLGPDVGMPWSRGDAVSPGGIARVASWWRTMVDTDEERAACDAIVQHADRVVDVDSWREAGEAVHAFEVSFRDGTPGPQRVRISAAAIRAAALAGMVPREPADLAAFEPV